MKKPITKSEVDDLDGYLVLKCTFRHVDRMILTLRQQWAEIERLEAENSKLRGQLWDHFVHDEIS